MASNYRPITLTSHYFEIVENVIHNHVLLTWRKMYSLTQTNMDLLWMILSLLTVGALGDNSRLPGGRL